MKFNDKISKLTHSSTVGEAVRFVLVGVGATALHYAIYWLLLPLLGMTLSFTIGYGVSFLMNFLLSARFTFRAKATTLRGVGFAASHLVNYLLQVGTLHAFTALGVPARWAPLPVYAVCIPVNFLLVRFVFTKIKEKV